MDTLCLNYSSIVLFVNQSKVCYCAQHNLNCTCLAEDCPGTSVAAKTVPQYLSFRENFTNGSVPLTSLHWRKASRQNWNSVCHLPQGLSDTRSHICTICQNPWLGQLANQPNLQHLSKQGVFFVPPSTVLHFPPLLSHAMVYY